MCLLHDAIRADSVDWLASRLRFSKIRPVNLCPLDIAIRHISETRHLLEDLITSSETFEYRKAKAALEALRRKTRELGKAQAALQGPCLPAPNVVRLRVNQ